MAPVRAVKRTQHRIPFASSRGQAVVRYDGAMLASR